MQPNASSFKVKACNNSGAVQLDVFRNVRFVRFSNHFKIGVCARVEFDAPEHVASMKDNERTKYWKFLLGSKTLQHDTIVCVFSTIEGQDCLYFAVVAQRKIEVDQKLGSDVASIPPTHQLSIRTGWPATAKPSFCRCVDTSLRRTTAFLGRSSTTRRQHFHSKR